MSFSGLLNLGNSVGCGDGGQQNPPNNFAQEVVSPKTKSMFVVGKKMDSRQMIISQNCTVIIYGQCHISHFGGQQWATFFGFRLLVQSMVWCCCCGSVLGLFPSKKDNWQQWHTHTHTEHIGTHNGTLAFTGGLSVCICKWKLLFHSSSMPIGGNIHKQMND